MKWIVWENKTVTKKMYVGLSSVDIVRLFQYICEYEDNVKENLG